jgi:hypothetical protein
MKQHKIKLIALLLSTGSLFVAESSYADGQSVYIGASAGYSALNTPSGDVFSTGASNSQTLITETGASSDTGGFGGSLFAGYKINPVFAVELGYTTYAESNYNSTQDQYQNIGTVNGHTEWAYLGSNTSSVSYNTYSIDLFLKASVPVIAQVSAFAKVGASYVNQSVDYSNPAGLPSISVDSAKLATPEAGTNSYKAIRPSGALGLSFQTTEHLATSIFAQGFLGKGDMETDSSAIASAYIVGASLAYTF